MLRLRKFASPIASLSVALLMFALGNAARGDAAETAPDGGSNWQAANNSDNPFRASQAAQWSPVRTQQPRVTTASADTPQPTTPAKSLPRVTPASATTQWQLPNGKPTAGSSAPQQLQTATVAREPQPFNAPTNATRMSSPTQRNTNVAPWNSVSNPNVRPTTSFSPPTSPTAPRSPVTNTARMSRGPAAATNSNNTNIPAARPTTPGRIAANPRATYPPSTQPAMRGSNGVTRKVNTYSSRMWDSIAVAFQEPQSLVDGGSPEPENLPMPGGNSAHGAPMMHGGHEMMGPEFDGGYGYDAGQGGCSCPGGCSECGPMCGGGMCGCEPGCGCGCGDGCCEPACGCPQGGCDVNFCGQGDPAACTTVRIGVPKWQDFVLFGGVQGFKGPYDQFRDSGNFGFHDGFNAGFKFPFTSMGYQIGYRAVHSQLNGDKDTDISDPHTQQFTTFGVFQRVKDGIQGGIVWDTLRDERWNAIDFHQVRGELSFIDHGCHELGLSASVHLNDDEQFFFDNEENIFSIIYQASDQYLAFYRFHGCNGGEGRFYGGFNDDSDGIIGADMLLPVSNRWSVSAAFTYLIPDAPAGEIGAQQEAWNISLALVWHWDCAARRSHNNCYRPLFNVADNGYLIVDDRPGSHVIEIDNGG